MPDYQCEEQAGLKATDWKVDGQANVQASLIKIRDIQIMV